MGAPGLQDQGDEAVPVFFLYNMIMSHRPLSVFKIDLPLNKRASGPADGSVDRAGRGDDTAPDNSQIFSFDFMTRGHGGQNTGADHVLRNDSQAGCVPVKPVRAPEDKRFALLLIIIHQCIGKGVPVIVQRRVNWHSGRFVDNNDVFIFIYNVQRKLHWRNIGRTFRFPDVDREDVAAVKRSAHVGPDTVYKDALGHLFELRQVLV